MSSQRKRREKIEKILRRISGESNSGTVIIVEGKNDKETLRKLGLTGPILCFKSSGRGLIDFLSQIHAKKVMLLTDFDREGRDLSARMAKELAQLRIRTDDVLRRQLGALIKQDLRTVEGLSSLVEKMRTENEQQRSPAGSEP
jgi:5S rRNA maturation endonuclease (ribonuclease M5)